MLSAAFQELVDLLRPRLQQNKMKSRARTGLRALTPEEKVMMFLRYLAGGKMQDIRKNICSKTFFYDTISQVCSAVNELPELKLHFPSNESDIRDCAAGYGYRSLNVALRGCIGAVDGWLVEIQRPTEADVGPNVRKFFSSHYDTYGINVQLLCDSSYRIRAVCAKHAGATNDALAYMRWNARQSIENLPVGCYVVADNAYTCSYHVITPFTQPQCLTPEHGDCNIYCSQLRITVE
jgi:hypothetical protein